MTRVGVAPGYFKLLSMKRKYVNFKLVLQIGDYILFPVRWFSTINSQQHLPNYTCSPVTAIWGRGFTGKYVKICTFGQNWENNKWLITINSLGHQTSNWHYVPVEIYHWSIFYAYLWQGRTIIYIVFYSIEQKWYCKKMLKKN